MFRFLSCFKLLRKSARQKKSDSPASTKSILFVSTHCPTRGHAGGLRILDICSRIRAIAPNIVIDIYTRKNEGADWKYTDVIQMFDNVYYSENEEMNFKNFTNKGTSSPYYDIISFEYLQPSANIASFRGRGRKLLFTPMESISRAYSLESETASLSPADAKRWRLLEKQERDVSRLVDEVLCVSQPDMEFMRRRLHLENVTCLETCVSSVEFATDAATEIQSERFTVLYVAYFGAKTNIDALRWYIDAVHPVLREKFADYRLDVVGRGDLSQFHNYVDTALNLIGEVPQLSPHIARASVGIAPAVSGAGFRGKINQYALFGVPAVASSLAAEGLAYEDGQEIIVAATASAFAAGIARLLENPELRDSMGEKARGKCRANYSWETRDPEISRIFGLVSKA